MPLIWAAGGGNGAEGDGRGDDGSPAYLIYLRHIHSLERLIMIKITGWQLDLVAAYKLNYWVAQIIESADRKAIEMLAQSLDSSLRPSIKNPSDELSRGPLLV